MNRTKIELSKTALGIELGLTGIKAVLVDDEHRQIASGTHAWGKRLQNGVWTYAPDDIWSGLQSCYAHLSQDVYEKYEIPLEIVGAIGVSAMMHGYMVFDKNDELLVPLRGWCNNNTGEAAAKLTELFGFNIPERWSAAHLYQAIINEEEHVSDICYMTTLAGYVHWKLTGQKVLGIGDASGIFPINDYTRQYDSRMLKEFDGLVSDKGFGTKILDILPKVLLAGADAGKLTREGAKLLDPSGSLIDEISMCPPEGDAGTCMVATDSVKKRSGNMSAGASVYAMAVLERPMSAVHPQADIVTTPAGDPVALVRCDKCLKDMDTWANSFGEATKLWGAQPDSNELYDRIYDKIFHDDAQVNIETISNRHITGFSQGCTGCMHLSNSKHDLKNFIRNHFFCLSASLMSGLSILLKEGIKLDSIVGHGTFFEAYAIGQKMMTNALGVPVKVISGPHKDGSWGMAVLAAYTKNNKGESLADYLSGVFADTEWVIVQPDAEGVEYKAEVY